MGLELKDIDELIAENDKKQAEIKAESSALLKIKKRLEKGQEKLKA